MYDSNGWRGPVFIALILLALVGAASLMNMNDKVSQQCSDGTIPSASAECEQQVSGIFYVCAVGLFGVLLLFRIASKWGSGRHWTKPTARVLNGQQVEVIGDVNEIQMLGIPGAIQWVHVGPNRWRIELQVGHNNPNHTDAAQTVADLINGWNGSMNQ